MVVVSPETKKRINAIQTVSESNRFHWKLCTGVFVEISDDKQHRHSTANTFFIFIECEAYTTAITNNNSEMIER